MRYCTNCILPDTHETIEFDENGVCNICNQAKEKHESIDWKARRAMLDDLIERNKGKGEYDCILPFSGGKDSTFQLWFVVTQLKLKPLVVRYDHWGYRPQVESNNERTFKTLGVDVLQFKTSWPLVRKLMLSSLKKTGDFCWFCHTGVFAHTMQIAVKFKIPLVIFGESTSEYRAYHSFGELETLNEKLFNEMINLSITADDMYDLLNGEVDRRDLIQFEFPSEADLQAINAAPIWLGNYISWNTRDNVKIIKEELGWQGAPVEGIPHQYDYEKIECKYQGARDYCKYIKRGHGRTNHLACIDIRNGDMDRETGMQLAEEYDGRRPASLDYFLEIIGITEAEFLQILTENEITSWGFDPKKQCMGDPLPDMESWSKIV